MSSVQRFAASSFTASWSILPNEVKAEIVRHLDLASALALMRLGGVEKEVVREFGCFDVGINVISSFLEIMLVQLRSHPGNIMVQSWIIRPYGKGSVVQQTDGSDETVNHSFYKTPMAKMAFSIVGRLMSDSIFKVQKLEFALRKYHGMVKLNLKEIIDVKFLVITRCHKLTTRSLLENEMIETDSWVVTSENREELRWAKKKITKMCIERELDDMVIEKAFPNTIIICPSKTADTFFTPCDHNH